MLEAKHALQSIATILELTKFFQTVLSRCFIVFVMEN